MKSERTTIILMAPETERLPEDMGALERHISDKSDRRGEIITVLSEGFTEKSINCYLATINLKKRFQRENHWNVIKLTRTLGVETMTYGVLKLPM